MNLINLLLNIFIPLKCPICSKWLSIKREKPVCENCLTALDFIPKHEIINGIDIFSVALYKDKIKNLIHEFKYNKNLYLGKFLSKILSEKIDTNLYKNFDFIIPVPLHKKKLDERGFNQSEIFAFSLGKKIKKPVKKRILFRKRYTLPQAGMKKQDRLLNVKNAFKCIKPVFEKNIILVDDVFTTGFTVMECIKELKHSGAKKINVVVFARP